MAFRSTTYFFNHKLNAELEQEGKAMENKQQILDLLVPALQATRDQHDLVSLTYEDLGNDRQEVVIEYEGGSRRVNVSLDSGIAMIRDVLRAME